MNIIVFEDAGVNKLFPITIGRPAYAITCATFQLQDLLPQLGVPAHFVPRPHLRGIQELDFPSTLAKIDSNQDWTLVVNARTVPANSNIQLLRDWAKRKESWLVRAGDSIAAAMVPTSHLNLASADEILASLKQLPIGEAEQSQSKLRLFEYPHDVVRENLNAFTENINFRVAQEGYREIADGVFVQGEVTISEFVVTNTQAGPILIDEGSVIGPFCFLRGPIHIGRNCRINEHAAIKDKVSMGHTIKMGGEIEGSVIEAYSNKQHHGFLGHSYLGSWVNLGAGTCNSDLKNTYGEVKMEYGGVRVSTGMQFVGCIMGDYAKSAINTSIFTGKTVGAGSMLYGFVTTNVPSFVNYARSFGQITESPAAILELTQKRMFDRRNVDQRSADIQLIYDMYQLTTSERQLSEEPLML